MNKTTKTTTHRAAVREPPWERVPRAEIVRSADEEKGAVLEMVPLVLKMERILVPIDFSETSEKALRYAVPFAQQFGAKVTLLYVLLPPYSVAEYPFTALDYDEKATQRCKHRLDTFVERVVPNAVRGQTLVKTGHPFYEIVETAKELNTDLIILTTHGYTGLKHAFIGSTAERVVRHAPCPVLVVREREHEFV